MLIRLSNYHLEQGVFSGSDLKLYSFNLKRLVTRYHNALTLVVRLNKFRRIVSSKRNLLLLLLVPSTNFLWMKSLSRFMYLQFTLNRITLKGKVLPLLVLDYGKSL